MAAKGGQGGKVGVEGVAGPGTQLLLPRLSSCETDGIARFARDAKKPGFTQWAAWLTGVGDGEGGLIVVGVQ